MVRLAGSYDKARLEQALRNLGEEPVWEEKTNGQQKHSCRRFQGVVNIYTTKGTVTVQGLGAEELAAALRRALAEANAPAAAAAPPAVGAPTAPAAVAPARPPPGTQMLLPGAGPVTKAGVGGSDQPVEWHIYVDGSCWGNANVTRATRAGWGAAVYGPQHYKSAPIELLFGPVVVDDQRGKHFLGAEVGSNNTGELCGIAEAVLWLTHEASGSGAAVIYYDSEYAANIAVGRYNANKNQALARRVQAAVTEARRIRDVKFVKVKGHSGNPGNELADQLANKGMAGEVCKSRRWRDFELPAASASSTSASGAASVATGTPPVVVFSRPSETEALYPAAAGEPDRKRPRVDGPPPPAALPEGSVGGAAAGGPPVSVARPLVAGASGGAAAGEQARKRARADPAQVCPEMPAPAACAAVAAGAARAVSAGTPAAVAIRPTPDAAQANPGATAMAGSTSCVVLFGKRKGASALALAQRKPQEAADYIARLQDVIQEAGLEELLREAVEGSAASAPAPAP